MNRAPPNVAKCHANRCPASASAIYENAPRHRRCQEASIKIPAHCYYPVVILSSIGVQRIAGGLVPTHCVSTQLDHVPKESTVGHVRRVACRDLTSGVMGGRLVAGLSSWFPASSLARLLYALIALLVASSSPKDHLQ